MLPSMACKPILMIPIAAENLLAAPATTDPVTALADDLELSLDAGSPVLLW